MVFNFFTVIKPHSYGPEICAACDLSCDAISNFKKYD